MPSPSKKKFIIGLSSLLLLLIGGGIYYFTTQDSSHTTKHNSPFQQKQSALLSLSNIDDFFQEDKTNDDEFLAALKPSAEKVKSVKTYYYSDVYDTMFLSQEIFFDFKGRPVKSVTYSHEDPALGYTYFFHNDKDKTFLTVNIGRNKYDTTYFLKSFTEQGLCNAEIHYNIKRDELNRLITRSFQVISDSEINIQETEFDQSLDTKEILPFDVMDMHITKPEEIRVKVHLVRTVCSDAQYNSISDHFYYISDNQLISEKSPTTFELNAEGNWITAKNEHSKVKREFSYYKANEPEVQGDFSYDRAVLEELDSMITTIPRTAWQAHYKRHAEITERSKMYAEGKYGKSIEKQEAPNIEDYTPPLWEAIVQDTGEINGFEGECIIVGYNTPLKDKYDFNQRCLAVFEKVGDHYVLRKQSIAALESFIDDDNDFSFHGYNEKNFYLDIVEGDVVVYYSYMRGEASYVYAYENNEWVLVRYESQHMTCCQAENYSYDYKTQTYSASVSSTTEEEESDTSFTIHQERPKMYMDSMNVLQYDYAETGLIVK